MVTTNTRVYTQHKQVRDVIINEKSEVDPDPKLGS